jgi:hypothetical protein
MRRVCDTPNHREVSKLVQAAWQAVAERSLRTVAILVGKYLKLNLNY